MQTNTAGSGKPKITLTQQDWVDLGQQAGWLKIAGPRKLERRIQDNNGNQIYVVTGDTYPIKQHLKEMGFRWYGVGKFWYIPISSLTEKKIEQLSAIGVDMSELNGTQETTTSPGEPPVEEPVQPEGPVVDTQSTDDPGKSKYYGFPIKKNIFVNTFTIDVDGQPQDFTIEVHRGFEQGVRRKVIYRYGIKWNGKNLGTFKLHESPKWNPAEEPQLVSSIQGRVEASMNKVFDGGARTKLYATFQRAQQLSSRSPELVELLQKGFEIPGPSVALSTPKYSGEFKTKVHKSDYGSGINLYTDIEHPLAPDAAWLTSITIPVSIQTISELYNYIESEFSKHIPEIQKAYIRFLDSFPYSEEEQQQAKGSMDAIFQQIRNRTFDIAGTLAKFKELGFVRPHKRRLNVTDDSNDGWIFDDKVIINAAYSRKDTPDSFYSCIAYLVSRWKRNVYENFVSQVDFAIAGFARLAKQYGYQFQRNEVNDYIRALASKVFESFFGRRAPNSAWEEYEKFYNGNWGNNDSGYRNTNNTKTPSSSYVEQFMEFANQLGEDGSLAQSDPIKLFRKLLFKVHPDHNRDNPNAHELTTKLNNIFDGVRSELKLAWNWKDQFFVTGYGLKAQEDLVAQAQVLDAAATKYKLYCKHLRNIVDARVSKLKNYSFYFKRQRGLDDREINRELGFAFDTASSVLDKVETLENKIPLIQSPQMLQSMFEIANKYINANLKAVEDEIQYLDKTYPKAGLHVAPVVKSASSDLKLNRDQWEQIGKKTGWINQADLNS